MSSSSDSNLRRAWALWASRSFNRPILCLAAITSAAYGLSAIIGPCMPFMTNLAPVELFLIYQPRWFIQT
jgi:hypothetical protein